MVSCILCIWQIFFCAFFCAVTLVLFGVVMPTINKLTEEKLHKDPSVKGKKKKTNNQLNWFPVLSLLHLCLLWHQMRWFHSRCWKALLKSASYQNIWWWETNSVVVIFSGSRPQKTSGGVGCRRCFFKIICQPRWGVLRVCCNGWCLSSGFVALNSLLHLLQNNRYTGMQQYL